VGGNTMHEEGEMAEFIQLIEYTTTNRDDIERLMDEWLAATEGKRKGTGAITTTDRDTPNRYVEIVEFPSYEAAMENSNLPETAHFAEQFAKLCDDGPTFRNLDVVRRDNL
jgi:hypothetical protein